MADFASQRKEWCLINLAAVDCLNPENTQNTQIRFKASNGAGFGLCAKKTKHTKHTNSMGCLSVFVPFVFSCVSTHNRKALSCLGFVLFLCLLCVFGFLETKKGASSPPCINWHSNIQTSLIILRLVNPTSIDATPAATSLSMVTAICLVLLPLNTAFDLRLFLACSISLPCGNFSR